MNKATKYGVVITPAVVQPGQWYWKCVLVRHLTGKENHGQHHVFINALNAGGSRARGVWAGWSWEGKRLDERADPVVLDKPPTDFAMGNIAMHWDQKVAVRMIGQDQGDPDISDEVGWFHTAFEDEEAGNTRGHHSFQVVFQLVQAGRPPQPQDPDPEDPNPDPEEEVPDQPEQPAEPPTEGPEALTREEWQLLFELVDKLKKAKGLPPRDMAELRPFL